MYKESLAIMSKFIIIINNTLLLLRFLQFQS